MNDDRCFVLLLVAAARGKQEQEPREPLRPDHARSLTLAPNESIPRGGYSRPPRMLPELESLHCFVRAATSPSFRVAAKSVALSPAAFGDRIRRLEEGLGARLFQRTTRRVGLTAEGARLLPQARRCLEEAERCHAVVGSEGGPPFDIVIGTRFELGMSWLVPALGQLERARPVR